MIIFKRSLTRELISVAAGTFLVLLGIVMAQRAAYLINLAARGAIASDSIGTLLSFNLVKFLPLLFSLTIFLAVLLTLTRSYRDSEMVVWFSAGLGISKWIRPVINFALPVIVVITFLSVFIMPWAVQKSDEYKDQLKSRDDLASVSPGVFKESRNGEQMFFIESFSELGNSVKNIFVQSSQNGRLGIIVASRGYRETAENEDNFLVMENGRRYEGKPNTSEFSMTQFERYSIRILPNEVKQAPPSAMSKSSVELFESPDLNSKAELHWRFSIPISALILVLMAIPLSNVDPRAGRSLNFIMAILIYVIYNNLLSIMQAWVSQGKISPLIGLWPVHIFFLGLTVYMFYRRILQKPLIPSLSSLKFSAMRSNRGQINDVA